MACSKCLDKEKAVVNQRALLDLINAVYKLIGVGEADCMDDKSNVWRSAMLDATDAISRITNSK